MSKPVAYYKPRQILVAYQYVTYFCIAAGARVEEEFSQEPLVAATLDNRNKFCVHRPILYREYLVGGRRAYQIASEEAEDLTFA